MSRPGKKKRTGRAYVQVHMGIFVIYLLNSSHSIFSPFWRENFLVSLGRKHLNPTIIFLSPPLNQILSKKFSLLVFSHFFFILPKIHFIKHTLRLPIIHQQSLPQKSECFNTKTKQKDPNF